MITVAIQYPSIGPQHAARAGAIAMAAPGDRSRVVAMEMFARDSDYEWDPISCEGMAFERFTVMPCDSVTGRSSRRA